VTAAAAEAPPEVDLPSEGVSLDAVERAVLEEALRRNGGNVTRAAVFLRMGRGSLRYRLEKHGLASKASRRRGRPMKRRPPKAA
jgi:two-component system NtrC family response regulator